MTKIYTATKARTIYLRDLEFLVGLRCYVHIIKPQCPTPVEMIDFNTVDGICRFSELANYTVVYMFPSSDDHNYIEFGIYPESN